MKYCTRCGQKLNDEDTFCGNCGMPTGDIIQGEARIKTVESTRVDRPEMNGYRRQNSDQYHRQDARQYSNNGYGQQMRQQSGQYGNQQYSQNAYQNYNRQGSQQYSRQGSQQYGHQGAGQYNRQNSQQYSQQGSQQYNQQSYNISQTSGFNPIYLAFIPVGMLIVILIMIIAFNLRGASTYKGAVNHFFNALSTGSSKKVVSVMMPKKMETAANEAARKGELARFNYDDLYEAVEDKYGYYMSEDIEIQKVRIDDKEQLDRNYMKDVEKKIGRNMDIGIEIEDAYDIRAGFDYREKGSHEWNEDSIRFIAYRVKGKWFAIPENYL